MTFEHVIYIPGVLLLGMTVGYLLGAKAVPLQLPIGAED